jgi:hypothetical protein
MRARYRRGKCGCGYGGTKNLAAIKRKFGHGLFLLKRRGAFYTSGCAVPKHICLCFFAHLWQRFGAEERLYDQCKAGNL